MMLVKLVKFDVFAGLGITRVYQERYVFKISGLAEPKFGEVWTL